MAKRVKQSQSVTHLQPDSGVEELLSDYKPPRPIEVEEIRFIDEHPELHAKVQELATLAARICPELCQKNPSRAIEMAQALFDEARFEIATPYHDSIVHAYVEKVVERKFGKEGLSDEGLKKAYVEAFWNGELTETKEAIDGLPRKVAEYFDTIFAKYRSFENGVKFITNEKRFDRAMPWFRKFIGSQTPNDQACHKEIAEARKDGFTGTRLIKLSVDFRSWKAQEKSRVARIKSAKRKKKYQLS